MAANPYPEYTYTLNPNATITSNRCNKINENIINKNGFIVNNIASNIALNNSGSIASNSLTSNWYYFSINQGSILSNKIEGVILENNIGEYGIVENTSYDIFSNIAYGITNNRTRAIVDNEINQSIYPQNLQVISHNIINYDIINNHYSGAISNNIIKMSIWNNIFTYGGGDNNNNIINNTAYEIANNYS
jgi:hypothetical protein